MIIVNPPAIHNVSRMVNAGADEGGPKLSIVIACAMSAPTVQLHESVWQVLCRQQARKGI